MARAYTLRRRAEQQAETRQRIVAAAVELHTEIGPAQTTISLLAARAGVQRHTVYAHFPEERSLLQACSALALERDPFPEAAAWKGIADGEERLRKGVSALYAWFERNADLTAKILRDAEVHPPTAEIVARRFAEPLVALAEELSRGIGANVRQRAAVSLALSFFTWRDLVRGSGLSADEAVDLVVRAVRCAVDGPPPRRRGGHGDKKPRPTSVRATAVRRSLSEGGGRKGREGRTKKIPR